MTNIMFIKFIAGINEDGIRVSIENKEGILLKKEYSYGYNASYSRGFESKERPFIGDILKDLAEYYYVNEKHIVYSGYNYYTEQCMNPEEIENRIDKILIQL